MNLPLYSAKDRRRNVFIKQIKSKPWPLFPAFIFSKNRKQWFIMKMKHFFYSCPTLNSKLWLNRPINYKKDEENDLTHFFIMCSSRYFQITAHLLTWLEQFYEHYTIIRLMCCAELRLFECVKEVSGRHRVTIMCFSSKQNMIIARMHSHEYIWS